MRVARRVRREARHALHAGGDVLVALAGPIAWKAMRIVCSDDAQKRLTVMAGT